MRSLGAEIHVGGEFARAGDVSAGVRCSSTGTIEL